MRIYVVTLSDQLLANLIPILMDPPERGAIYKSGV